MFSNRTHTGILPPEPNNERPGAKKGALGMGFDLSGKRDGYFRASIYQMIFLRRVMIAAGVKPDLVYKKFVSNDSYFVTPLQGRSIASKVNVWLKGRNLILDLAETDKGALSMNKFYFGVIESLGTRNEAKFAKTFSSRKTIPVRINPEHRKMLRSFASFCDQSEGFWVQ
jgi:hypothetical protein